MLYHAKEINKRGEMKGIILAGGSGSRLYPSTSIISKHLLPVYDKPMIYYPISTLMFAGIRDILIISTPEDVQKYESILGDGHTLGLHFSYAIQEKPDGIARALIIAEDFIGRDQICLILGDNIFYGHGFPEILKTAGSLKKGGIIFAYWVSDPERYGIVELDKDENIINLEEKPKKPKSNYAIPGIYFYDNSASQIAKKLKPSSRGELEITDVNIEYLKKKELEVQVIGRGIAWLDAGTPQSLLDSANFISTIELRQGLKIACIEEIAYRLGYIDRSQLKQNIDRLPNCSYRDYLIRLHMHE